MSVTSRQLTATAKAVRSRDPAHPVVEQPLRDRLGSGQGGRAFTAAPGADGVAVAHPAGEREAAR